MRPYIFTQRNGIYVIDLQKTVRKLEDAYRFIKEVASEGRSALFVGTKKQAQDSIKEEALRSGSYYVNTRWLGGMLTNFKTIRGRVERLKQLRKMREDGTFELLPKKEVIKLELEITKLECYLGGVEEMNDLPGVLFIVDPSKEKIAVAEARKLKIPVIAIVDTNCDPNDADLPIPANDDAIRSVKLISGVMADAILEAKEGEVLVGNSEDRLFGEKDEELLPTAENNGDVASFAQPQDECTDKLCTNNVG